MARSDSDFDTDARKEQLAQLRRLQAEFGRIWQGLRERVDRPCAVCGTVMHGVVKNRKYCSVACQAKAWRQRHPDYVARRRARRQTPPTPADPEPGAATGTS